MNIDITVNRNIHGYLLSTIIENRYFKHRYSCYDLITAKKLFKLYVKRELSKLY